MIYRGRDGGPGPDQVIKSAPPKCGEDHAQIYSKKAMARGFLLLRELLFGFMTLRSGAILKMRL